MPPNDPRRPLDYFRPLAPAEREDESLHALDVACAALAILTMLVTPGVCLVGSLLPWWTIMPVQWALAGTTIAVGAVARRVGGRRGPPSKAADFALAVGTLGAVVPTAVLLIAWLARSR